ncbi:MAG: hypothetical protein GY723_03910 [bacterium]|nr:hypothetical protein [bacterium]
MEKLDRLDGELGRDHEGALAPGSPAKTARYAKYEIEPELFGLEPWPEDDERDP